MVRTPLSQPMCIISLVVDFGCVLLKCVSSHLRRLCPTFLWSSMTVSLVVARCTRRQAEYVDGFQTNLALSSYAATAAAAVPDCT